MHNTDVKEPSGCFKYGDQSLDNKWRYLFGANPYTNNI